MVLGEHFTVADEDFYLPPWHGDAGTRFAPTAVPARWTRREFDVWTMWSPADVTLPEQGWKVHVSATLTNASRVLEVVAGICARLGVPFKHLTGRGYFILMHGKHASRTQSGKFCAVYPPKPELAHAVLEDLADALAGIDGPYVLTDRRYRDSTCVSYRFGSFRSLSRLEADGTSTPMMTGLDGNLVPDERRPEFLLPDGVADPFAPAEPAQQPDDDAEIAFHGYTFEKVLQYSNAGGAYRARDTAGERVFVKEARAHNGYLGNGSDARFRLEREYLLLRAVHAAAPGLCPRPIDYFGQWENHYLVTELVPGKTLVAWSVAHTPVVRVDQQAAVIAEYYRRCVNIIAQLRAILDRLHALGYVFVDLSPRNVLVDADDRVRLVDFESAQRSSDEIQALATPGFCPPRAVDPQWRASVPAELFDDYALGGITQQLLFPLHQVVLRNPEALDHLIEDLASLAPVPRPLRWELTRFAERVTERTLPTPAALRAQPLRHLAELRDRTADALLAMAGRSGAASLFPSVPDGYRSNLRCLAWGAAGVLHSLHVSGVPVEPAWVRRLRDESVAAVDDTPPGLLYGTAGISWVLSELGEHAAADELLDAARTHPLLADSATVGGGAAGLALALMHRHCVAGDGPHLSLAAELLDRIPVGADLPPLLGKHNASGFANGRTGIALALYYLARLTGDPEPIDRGMALLREELTHALPYDTGGIGFAMSDVDNRNMPYLFCGSAGYARVLARYLTVRQDNELADVLERCLRTMTVRFTVSSGLFQGQAGFALTFAELATLLDRTPLRDEAISSAMALVKHSVPHQTGVRWLGQHGQRLSADLWSGSAGVLLALQQVLSPVADPLCTLDEHVVSLAPV